MSVEPLVQKIGKYVVLDVIGTGGMGVVYRAHDPTLKRTVAIKMLKSSSAGIQGAQFQKYFARELTATASLQHKNIVTVYESGEYDGVPYLVMEYLQGKPVSQVIEERSVMPLAEKLDVVIQVCDGLQYAHNRNPQIIHRDVKPANVILLVDGVAKIVDFGIARVVGNESTIIQTGQLLGSLSYMSPEQVNSLPIDARTDIFSIGVLLYQFLTYSLPFKGADTGATLAKILREDPAPLATVIEGVPPGLQECLSRALAKDPDARYQSAGELGFDLLQIQKKIRDGMAADLLHRAEAAVQRGDLEKARLSLEEIVRVDRQHERANRLLAEVRKTTQNQQRAAQVMQMLSQARVGLAGRQFALARACVDQALQLNPKNEESLALSDQILNASAQAQSAEKLLGQAEAALRADDLDEARKAVSAALTADPANSEAHAIETIIEKQQDEQARRYQAQTLIEGAHRSLSEHKYDEAIGLLGKAKDFDASDPRPAELMALANQGQQQEQRKQDLQALTERVDGALRTNDLAAACAICDVGLEQFPQEPALLRLKSIAESLRYTAEKRKFVQDEILAARNLTESRMFQQAVESLTLALAKFPGEPSLTATLAEIRSVMELRKRLAGEDVAPRTAVPPGLSESSAPASIPVLLADPSASTVISLQPSLPGKTVSSPPPSKHRNPFLIPGLILASLSIAGFAIHFILSPSPGASSPAPKSVQTTTTPDKDRVIPSSSSNEAAGLVTNAVPPSLTSLSQTSIPVGSPGLKLTITGSGFVPNQTQVLWNGSARRTKVMTDQSLTAELSRADVAVAKTASIAIQTPAGKSTTLLFSVEAVLPPAEHAVITPPAGGTVGAAPPKNLSISSGVMAGSLIDRTVPVYPAVARAARIQGTVVLQATIAKSGSIKDLRVISGPPLLQKAALDAVKTWRYSPYLVKGKKAEVQTTINVVFNLGGGGPPPPPQNAPPQ